jgi:hypothetical protein
MQHCILLLLYATIDYNSLAVVTVQLALRLPDSVVISCGKLAQYDHLSFVKQILEHPLQTVASVAKKLLALCSTVSGEITTSDGHWQCC